MAKEQKSPQPPTSTATVPVPEAFVAAMPPEGASGVRLIGVVDPSSIPEVPADFQSLDQAATAPLIKVAATQVAELHAATAEMSQRQGDLQRDLGRRAPDGKRAETLRARMVRIAQGKARTKALVTYYDDLELVTYHDAMSMAIKCNRAIEYAAEEHLQIASRYPAITALKEQRGAAISDGMRKAADKAASDKAASDKAASDKAASDKAASDKAASDKNRSDAGGDKGSGK